MRFIFLVLASLGPRTVVWFHRQKFNQFKKTCEYHILKLIRLWFRRSAEHRSARNTLKPRRAMLCAPGYDPCCRGFNVFLRRERERAVSSALRTSLALSFS